jgi:hypothetical protein
MGQSRHLGCGVGDPDRIIEVGERHRPGTHQRAVPRRTVRMPAVVVGRGGRELGTGAHRREHRASLVLDVFRLMPPGDETITERVEIEPSGNGLLCDADRDLGVVGPLTGFPMEGTSAGDPDRPGERRPELVPCPQGIAGR